MAIFSFSVSIQYSYKCNLAIFSDKLIGLVLGKGFIALTKANTLELASWTWTDEHRRVENRQGQTVGELDFPYIPNIYGMHVDIEIKYFLYPFF